MERTDHALGFPAVLSGLTKGAEYPEQKFQAIFDEMYPANAHVYKIIVIVDNKLNKIVGSGSVIMEQKFARNTGVCGHIEDIVVDKGQRGRRLGLRIIDCLTKIAYCNPRCYKIILDCAEHNVKFYNKCGYKTKEIQMVQYKD